MEDNAALTPLATEAELPLSPSQLTQNASSPDVMAQFLTRFDPLAMLEAEYAAVLAQSSSNRNDDVSSRTTTNQQCDTDSRSDDSSDDSSDGGDDATHDAYAQLPMSPTGSDVADYQPLGDASDDDDDTYSDDTNDGTNAVESTGTAASMNAPQLDAATRTAVMQSMQRLTLQPPSWARDAKLSDADLVAIVQQQLQR